MQLIYLSIVLLFGLTSTVLQAGEVRLFTWEGYFSDEILADFEKQTGHTVKQIYFESESLRDDVVYSGKASAYDLFILDGYTVKTFGEKGILNAINPSLSSELAHFSDGAKEACHQYGIPYSFGSIGIGYRSSKVTKTFNSWMDIFDYAKENPGKVVIPDEDMDTVAIALMALGYHPMTNEESELKEAYKLLNEVIDDLLVFRNSLGYAIDEGKDSLMDVAVFYSGETEQISKTTGQDDWEYTIPREGTLLWYECFSSLANKPLNQASLSFLQFISTPKNAIENAEEIWFATANDRSLMLANDEYLNDTELFPPAAAARQYYYYEPLSSNALKIRGNIINVLSKE